MQGFKFTCQAASYSDGQRSYTKGMVIVLPEGDPRLRDFRGLKTAKVWKEEPLTLPDEPAAPAASQPPEGSTGGQAPTLADLVTPPQLAALNEAGFHSLLDVASAKPEDLQGIKGIGEKTIAKLQEAVGARE